MGRYQEEVNFIAMQDYMEKLAGRTVLVAGATGMIGKCLVDVFMKYNEASSNPIYIIACGRSVSRAKERFAEYWNNNSFQFVEVDVNTGISECGMIDFMIHAASNTHPVQYASDPIGTINTNVFGTKNLLDYAVTHQVKRFCFLSSVEIYGENQSESGAFCENDMGYFNCNTVRSGYPESKRLGESLCNAYGQVYGKSAEFSYVIPRLSRIYGPTMLESDSKAIAQFVKKAAAGDDIVLKSEGTQVYSYTFVTDAVAGILIALTKGVAGEAYNVADKDSDISIKELAGMLAKLAGTKVIFEVPNEKEARGYSGLMRSTLNAEKLEKLGWQARVCLQDGLTCCVDELKK